MPGARDTELLNNTRSAGQAPPSPPQCQFNHWGLTVYLPPELAKQFEPPADYVAFAEFMEQMLPQCRVFMSAYPGTRAEDPHKILQAFIDHFMTPSPDNPIPNFRRYGHKGHGPCPPCDETGQREGDATRGLARAGLGIWARLSRPL